MNMMISYQELVRTFLSADSGVFDQLFGESAIDHDAISYVRDAGMITR